MITQQTIEQYGQLLFDCLQQRTTTSPLIELCPELTIDDAYKINLHFLALRLKYNKEQVVGKKIGVTSPAVQNMLGVYQPDFGFLTDAMVCTNGKIDTSTMIQPRAEAEIAFRLKHGLQGPDVTPEEVLKATEVIIPAFEIVDSRIENWKISICDTVSDNASCGVYVLGDSEIDPGYINLSELEAIVTKNGAFLSRGKGDAVLGNPLNAVAWLANTLGDYGVTLDAGETILSGSMVPLEPASKGDVFEMQIDGLGACKVLFQ